MLFDEAKKKSIEFFGGDELAADTYLKKYSITKGTGEFDAEGKEIQKYLEPTPEYMWRRMAKAGASIEKVDERQKWEKEFTRVFEGFKAVPQGSIMFALGNPYQKSSCSNCFVFEVNDSLDGEGSIFRTAEEMARTYSYRGGCGLDISPLRPTNAEVNNAAKSTSGAASWMEFYSFVTRMIGINGRRGALMLTMGIDHPDIELFTKSKHDLTKVTGANISIRITDDFMKAVEGDKKWVASFSWVSSKSNNKETVSREWKARDLWKIIVDSATNYAEPGLLFWDNIINNSPADCYADLGFKTICTNPSLREDTLILTDSGVYPIRHLAENNPNPKVMNLNKEWKNCSVFKSGENKQLVKITFTNGQTVYCTKEHKWPVINTSGNLINPQTGKVIKKEALSLERQDKIYFPTLNNIINNKSCTFTNEDGFVLGWNTGNGWKTIHKSQNSIQYGFIFSDEDIKSGIGNRILSYTNALAKTQSKLRQDHDTNSTSYVTTDSNVNNKMELLGSCYKDYGVPKSVWTGNIEFINGFVDGLFSADSYVRKTNKISTSGLVLISSHRNLVYDIQKLLAFYGIRTNIRFSESTSKFPRYNSNKIYQRYDLHIYGLDVIKFAKQFSLSNVNKQSKLNEILSQNKDSINEFGRINYANSREYIVVKSAELTDLYEDVYDISVDDDTHTFVMETGLTGNCSELPLSRYDSCTLLSMNLAQYTRNDFKDDAFFDEKSFFADTYVATRFLDNVKTIDSELVPLPQQKEISKKGRRIGMGIHGLADAMANLKIKYDSAEGVKFINELFEKYTKAVYGASVELAKEKGAFPIFDAKREKGNAFLERIGYAGVPRRNIACMTLAPTGTVSLISQTSSGIEPVFRNSYKRRVKIVHNMTIKPEDEKRIFVDSMGEKWLEYEVFHQNVERYLKSVNKETGDELPKYFVTSDRIDWEKRVDIQAAITHWLDHSCSSTINLPKGTSSETVGNIYMKAWKSGCKGMTVYVDGCRDGVLITDEGEKKRIGDKSSSYDAIQRPNKIPCDIYQIKADGENWTVLVGLVDGKPYEIFCGRPKKVELGKTEKGYVEKESKGKYSLHIGEDTILKDISDIFSETQGAITRLISTSLRHGVNIQFIVQQLEKSDGSIVSFNKAITRVLKKYVADGVKENGVKCKECGKETIIREEGCVKCSSCGWTKCN